ncbi:hypothetical protein [Erwinia amylovora]|uniref:hypothetical protein n=1 Tax=Erwinia amylovora TaxID=552 RepID=UPI0014444C06|nr:hypothetical protein [Erwinia amylovora]
MIKHLKISLLFLFSISINAFAYRYDNLNKFNSLNSVVGIFKDQNLDEGVKKILGEKYKDFIGNFDVYGEPHQTENNGLFIEGWLQDLRMQSASAMVIEPDGTIYAAWLIPDNSRIVYFTNDKESNGIQPDIKKWGERFENVTFNEKEMPPGFVNNEPETRYLNTPGFVIRVDLNCSDKHKVCNNATYSGKRKSDGATLILSGKVIRFHCDSIVCPVNVYEFNNKNTKYILETDDSSLTVKVNGKKVLAERGVWTTEPQRISQPDKH